MRVRLHWSLLVGLALVPLILVLAALQYLWIGEVSRSEATRMQTLLISATRTLAGALDEEIGAMLGALAPDARTIAERDWGTYAEQVSRYQREGHFPRLAQAIYLLLPEEASWSSLRWASERGRFEPAEIPAAKFVEPGVLDAGKGIMAVGEHLFAVLPQLAPLPEITDAAGRQAADGQAVFVQLLPKVTSRLVVELDLPTLTDSVLPQLVSRSFSAALSEYTVGVVSPAGHTYAYGTEPVRLPDPPDVSMPLFSEGLSAFWIRTAVGMAERGDQSLPDHRFRVEEPSQGVRETVIRTYSFVSGAVAADTRPPSLLVVTGDRDQDPWRLVAGHRSGSLAVAVATARRRNLAVSFGILLVLAAGIAMLSRAVARTRELARREREFVASVSHELKTPLGVILAVGQNLESGIVTAGERVREYGATVGSEGRRLREMIDNILASARFGAGLPGSGAYRAEHFDPDVVFDEALSRVAAAVPSKEPEGTVEGPRIVRVARAPDSSVLCDRAAFLSTVENLLSNALLHGRPASGPVAVSSCHARFRARLVWALEVADQGPGIPRAERARLFQPFTRGALAVAEQVPGSGLGLSIARAQARTCGGEVVLLPAHGRGARFRLMVPLVFPGQR